LRYRELRPRPPLDRFLECFWFADAAPPPPDALPERIVPDGCPEVIVHAGDPFERVDDEGVGRPQPRSFLVGALTRPLHLRPTGRVGAMGVRFRPFGLTAFLSVPLRELTDQTTPLGDIWNGEATRLEERLGEARTDEERAKRAERFFLDRLRLPRVDAAIEECVSLILRARGQVRIDPLARRMGVSRRQVERRFQDAVGLSPKALARIVRFQEVLRRSPGEGTSVDIALDCGYYDQAHLLRDFRDFAGVAPRVFRSAEGDLARQFTSPTRLDRFFG
jgi:AraC-like DNA-binding protein